MSYKPADNQWSALGDNPFLPNCDSAIAKKDDNFVVVSGEIKPGLRTPEVKSLEIDQARATWARLADLPTPLADTRQEGVAGAGGANYVAPRRMRLRESGSLIRGCRKSGAMKSTR